MHACLQLHNSPEAYGKGACTVYIQPQPHGVTEWEPLSRAAEGSAATLRNTGTGVVWKPIGVMQTPTGSGTSRECPTKM